MSKSIPPGDTDIFIITTRLFAVENSMSSFLFHGTHLPVSAILEKPPAYPLWEMIVWFESLRVGVSLLHPITVLVTRHRSEESLTEKGSSDYYFIFGNDHTALHSTLDGVYTFITITLEHTQPWIVELRSTSPFDDIQLLNISTWSSRPIDPGPLCSVRSY